MTVIIVLLIIFAGIFIALYNRIIKLKYLIKDAWSGIDVQLKRRYDLITSLVESVKGYAKYESGTLEKVIALRQQSFGTNSIKEKGKIENELAGVIKSIFALTEAYPDLKANQNFINLQQNVTETENQLQMARRYYNGTVRDYNTLISQIPGSIVAGMFNFTPAEFFEISEAAEKERPEIKFE